jgi:hypothetical protein
MATVWKTRKHHAKKDTATAEARRPKRTVFERRRKPTQATPSAVRATRGGNTPRPGRRN